MSKVMDLLGRLNRTRQDAFARGRFVDVPDSFMSDLMAAYQEEAEQARDRETPLEEETEAALRAAIRKGDSAHAVAFYDLLQRMKKESSNG